MTRNPTRVLAEAATGVSTEVLRPPVEARARALLLDYFGVLIGGSAESAGKQAGNYARLSGVDESSVCFLGCSTAPLAALANGIAAHALELDDVTNESSLHPGVVVWPSAMAAVERAHGTLGDLLAAGLAGYEVVMRVGEAFNAESLYARGFHPTGIAGAIGSAAAVANVIGLDADRTQHAFGLVGSMVSGSLAYVQNGSDGKRLNAGWASKAGLVASDLAGAGLTGPVDVLSGTYGLLDAYSDKSMPEALLDVDFEHPAMLDVAVKPYACCRYIHPVIDACYRLRSSEAFVHGEIDRVTLSILPGGGPIIADPAARKRRPQNRVDAQFSVYYGAALTLVYGLPGMDGFDVPYLHDPAIHSVADRVEIANDGELDARYPKRWGWRLHAVFSDGRQRSIVVDDPRGDAKRPLSSDELNAKFRSIVEPVDPRLAATVPRWVRESNLRVPIRELSGGCTAAA